MSASGGSGNARALLERARARLQAGDPGAAAPLLREWVGRHPDQAEGRHLLGLALVQTGRTAEGLDALRRSVALGPAEPMFPRNLGLVLAELGLLDEAGEVLENLVARWPSDALAHDALGTVHQRRGAYAAAVAAHERALALAPRADAAWGNYAAALLGAGRIDAAADAARKALALNPGNALAALNLGNAMRDGGDPVAAAGAYRLATSIAPTLATAWHNLGTVLREVGDFGAALECFARAMRAAPTEPAHAAGFADAVGEAALESLPAPLLPAAVASLERPEVDVQGLAVPLFRALLGEAGPGPALSALAAGAEDVDLAMLVDARLCALLERTLVADATAEVVLTRLRRSCLRRLVGAAPGAVPLELACALAQQAFLGEYVWPAADDEAAAVGALADELASEKTLAGQEEFLRLAVVGMYRRLADLVPAGLAPDPRAPAGVHRLWQEQVDAVREERALAESVRAVTAIRDPVSRAVRAQYEENPYPRWRAAPVLGAALPLRQKLRALFPWLGEASALPESPRILVAGCGTGRHPIATARLHPTARILAVDVSRASLGFALRRARELGVANVAFAQADLLELGGLGERFDVVECAGVLHHLADPLAGWRVLTGLLAPGGFMKVALYSEAARRGVVAARALIADRGLAADPEGIRALRSAILALPGDAPARAVAASPDFWSLSGCRDLLFHVQEHRFTLPQIEAALEALGLEFLGFELPSKVVLDRYRGESAGDPHGRSLSGWHDFEVRHPDTFAGMYQFWVRAAPALASARSGGA